MEVLEKRSDGTSLCILTPQEVAIIRSRAPDLRKWSVRGITALRSRPDAQSAFEEVVHAVSRGEAEREGARRAVEKRGKDGVVQDVAAKDVTGKRRRFFGWR